MTLPWIVPIATRSEFGENSIEVGVESNFIQGSVLWLDFDVELVDFLKFKDFSVFITFTQLK